MRKKILIVILVGFLVLSVVAASKLVVAKSPSAGQAANPGKPRRPEKLEQIIFVHPMAPDKPAKPDKPPGKPPKDEKPTDNTYYELWGGYLADNAEYYVNPDIGLVTAGDPVAAVNDAAEAWDLMTAADVFNYAGTTEKNWYELDGQNTISWVRFIPRDNIAVAVMWYEPGTMIIYEFDIVFNTFHRWGIDPVPDDKDRIKAFDIQNIATHEFGHPTGLADLYEDLYRELTMYGYSAKGETGKRTLEEGDIAGAQELHGAP